MKKMNIALKIVLISLLSTLGPIALAFAAQAVGHNIIGTIIGIISILLFVVGMGYVVYAAINFALEKNKSYERWASEHGFNYEKAQASSYVHYSRVPKVTFMLDPSVVLTKAVNQTIREKTNFFHPNPYIVQYAPFALPPFGYGTNKGIENVIYGKYKQHYFNAFTYFAVIGHNPATSLVSTGGGIVTFGVVAITSAKYAHAQPTVLENNIRAESGALYTIEQSMLKVDRIFPTLDELIRIDTQ